MIGWWRRPSSLKKEESCSGVACHGKALVIGQKLMVTWILTFTYRLWKMNCRTAWSFEAKSGRRPYSSRTMTLNTRPKQLWPGSKTIESRL